jgi:hypothetical protein
VCRQGGGFHSVKVAYSHQSLAGPATRTSCLHHYSTQLRERFRLPESKSVIVPQIIAATVDDGLIKPDESVGGVAEKTHATCPPGVTGHLSDLPLR